MITLENNSKVFIENKGSHIYKNPTILPICSFIGINLGSKQKSNFNSIITQVTNLNEPRLQSNGFMTPQAKAMSQLKEKSNYWLLPSMDKEICNRKTLVLDLDETLVHSSFEKIDNPEIVFPVNFFIT